MIQYLLFDTSKLLNISDITKRIGNFFKLPILLFYTITYPELALIVCGIGGYDHHHKHHQSKKFSHDLNVI